MSPRSRSTVFLWIAAALAAPAVAWSAATPPIGFMGAQLGISRAEWRAAPPPGVISPHTERACSDEVGANKLPLTAVEPAAGEVTCAYSDTYGALDLPVTFAYGTSSKVDHLRYGFVDDRLAVIQADVSLDAYDALVGDLTRRFGAPGRLVRDTVKSEIGPLPRVALTWNLPNGSIELIDPIMPKDKIGLQFNAPTVVADRRRAPS